MQNEKVGVVIINNFLLAWNTSANIGFFDNI